MSIITRMLRQTAVYWAHTGDDTFGQPTYDSPIQIKCRWQDMIVQFMDSKGRLRMSQAHVFVDRALVEGSLIWKGLLVDAPSTPAASNGAFEILKVNDTPNLRNTEHLRSVYL